jgi:hypothetical protein
MANPVHHAISSARKWGGEPEDYLAVHRWFDESKSHLADFRHRALRHHAQGIFWAEEVFGPTVTLSTCARCGLPKSSVMHDPDYQPEVEEGAVHEFVEKQIPTRWVGEQHVQEDLGRIPTMADWLRLIKPEPWMNRARKLSVELEREEEEVVT